MKNQSGTMIITLIYAECRGVIGVDDKNGNPSLPTHLPEDLKFFKKFTQGKTLVMGRKTLESLPKELEGRTVICLTRNEEYANDKADVIYSDVNHVYAFCADEGVEELVVAGGGEIYDMFLPMCDRVVKTRINHTLWPKREFERAKGKVFAPDLRERGEFSSADVLEKTNKMVVLDFKWEEVDEKAA